MRTVFALLFFICCIGVSNATLKLLKIKSAPLIYPARYQTVRYQSSPVVISEPIPATYARPVFKQSAHLPTYSLSAPSVVVYSAPAKTYAASMVYTKPTATYDVSPVWYYTEPHTAYADEFFTHLVEEHLSYDEHYKR